MSDTPTPATTTAPDIMALLRNPAAQSAPDADTAPQAAAVPEVALAPLLASAAVSGGQDATAAATMPAGDPVPAAAPAMVVGSAVHFGAAAPVAHIVSSKPRSAPYTLQWPVEYAGKLYTTVVRARPSAKQVGEYFEALMAQKDGDPDLRFPIFFDDAGALLPEPVWNAMDDDDLTALLTGLDDFLPQRLRRLRASAPAASTPADGAATEPTS